MVLCHCGAYQPGHSLALPQGRGQSFPACRDPSLRVLYIDDALIASTVKLDVDCVPLRPTLSSLGRLASCGLGVPGRLLQLEHSLHDVNSNDRVIGMQLNVKNKTNIMIFNPTDNRQCIPFCSPVDGQHLPVYSKMRLLGS